MNLNILIIQGTDRRKRMSIHATNLIAQIGKNLEGLEIKTADPAEFEIPYDGNDEENKNAEWVELATWADAYIIVTPEYNHGYSGSLKTLLDNDLGNYTHKPVMFAGVSSGIFGGARAIETLVNVVRELGMVATFTDINFPKVSQVFDKSGNLNPEKEELYQKIIRNGYSELVWMAKTLKWGRENVQS